MDWISHDPPLPRVGLSIKIDHSWMEHLFVCNTFEKSLDSKTLPERVKAVLLPTQLNGYVIAKK